MSTEQKIWDELRNAKTGVTRAELVNLVKVSPTTVYFYLKILIALKKLKVKAAAPRKHRGRPSSIYNLIDKAPAHPPIVKKL